MKRVVLCVNFFFLFDMPLTSVNLQSAEDLKVRL